MTEANDVNGVPEGGAVKQERGWILPVFTLFMSSGTLICCALPALFVTLGAGAALAGLVSAVPQLVWLSQYKVPLFAVAGAMLLFTGVWRYMNRNAPCPVDPLAAKTCMKMRRFSFWVYIVSCVIYATGFFFAFLAIHLL